MTDGQNDSSVVDGEVSESPVPLLRTKPVSFAPFVPKDPPPRQALMPRPANRQDRQTDTDVGKIDDTRQRPDSSSATNGGSGVSRAQSFQGRRPPPKSTAASRDGMMNAYFYGPANMGHLGTMPMLILVSTKIPTTNTHLLLNSCPLLDEPCNYTILNH